MITKATTDLRVNRQWNGSGITVFYHRRCLSRVLIFTHGRQVQSGVLVLVLLLVRQRFARVNVNDRRLYNIYGVLNGSSIVTQGNAGNDFRIRSQPRGCSHVLLHRHRTLRSVIKSAREVSLRQRGVVVHRHIWLSITVQTLVQLWCVHQSKNIATVLKLCMRDGDPGDFVTGVAWFVLQPRP